MEAYGRRDGAVRNSVWAAVEREALRTPLFEDGALSDLLLWTFVARREGLQPREVSVSTSSGHIVRCDATAGRVRAPQPPAVHVSGYRPSEHSEGLVQIAGFAAQMIPVVRLPGGPEFT